MPFSLKTARGSDQLDTAPCDVLFLGSVTWSPATPMYTPHFHLYYACEALGASQLSPQT